MQPAILRKKILAQRDALSRAEIRKRSTSAIQRLEKLDTFRQSHCPLFFISFRSEIDTHELIKARLAASLPVLVPKSIIPDRRLEIFRIHHWESDIESGAYGILEPRPDMAEKIVNPDIIDTVLVPGSVFDRHCGRYGYGGGFYDRFLQRETPDAVRIGLAFNFQVMEHIPLKPHDQRMDIIVTDSEIITCGQKAEIRQTSQNLLNPRA